MKVIEVIVFYHSVSNEFSENQFPKCIKAMVRLHLSAYLLWPLTQDSHFETEKQVIH